MHNRRYILSCGQNISFHIFIDVPAKDLDFRIILKTNRSGNRLALRCNQGCLPARANRRTANKQVTSSVCCETKTNKTHLIYRHFCCQFTHVIQSSYVWIDAHANQVSQSDPWHWINGQPSGMVLFWFSFSAGAWGLL